MSLKRFFLKCQKLQVGNWQIATDILIATVKAQGHNFQCVFGDNIDFLHGVQNIYANKQL